MAEIKSPLFTRVVPCPACGAKTSQGDFRSGMYVEEEREADQHVTRYRWLQADVTPLHPPHYALAHCPECAFTDFKEDFFDPARCRDSSLPRLVVPRLKAELARRGSVIRSLRQEVHPGPIDFPMALCLHLLAIAIHELLPAERRDPLKVGRLYLRTAWLYREQTSSASPLLLESEGLAALDQFATALRELQGAADHLLTVYSGSTKECQFGALAKQLEGVSKSYADLRQHLLGQAEVENPLRFLTVLRSEWPDLPLNEQRCLEASVCAFEQAYQKGEGDIIALLKLMIELNCRLGQFDRILEYAASLTKTAQEERTKLRRQLLGDRALSGDDRNRLTVRINRIDATIQLAAEIRRDVLARQAIVAAA